MPAAEPEPAADPLANLPPSDEISRQAAELVRRANILRKLARLAREREAEIAAAQEAARGTNGGGK